VAQAADRKGAGQSLFVRALCAQIAPVPHGRSVSASRADGAERDLRRSFNQS